MNSKDMFLLLQAEEALQKLNDCLEILTGNGYGEGQLTYLDNISAVIRRHSIPPYQNSDSAFFSLLSNKELSIPTKCEMLLGKKYITSI